MDETPKHESDEKRERSGTWRLRVQRDRLAILTCLAGLTVTGLAGWRVDRWARERDQERFANECRILGGMIVQKMERYESNLARLRDVCARHDGDVPLLVWNNWIGGVLNVGDNFPAIRLLAVAPKRWKSTETTDARGEVGQVQLPVAAENSRGHHQRLPLNADLAQDSGIHPSFKPSLGQSLGWVSKGVWRVAQTNGNLTTGFWFALSLRRDAATESIPWRLGGESDADATARIRAARASQATGVLVSFVGGDRFFSEFNQSSLLHVQCFASREAEEAEVLNPEQRPPGAPWFTKDELLPWYGRRWLARFTSKPAFQAESIRYRSWLVLGVGSLLSVVAGGVVATQARAQWRERELAGQLRSALARQERINRDLHDGTLQSIYGIGLGVRRAQHLIERQPGESSAQLADISVALQRVVEELRLVIREADHAATEEISLGDALVGMISHMCLATGMELKLDAPAGVDRGLSASQSLQLLNIARELLSNGLRHSGARRLEVRLRSDGTVFRFWYSDDGVGFCKETSMQAGHGLRNLEIRVRELGGQFQWDTSPGHGTRFFVELALDSNKTS